MDSEKYINSFELKQRIYWTIFLPICQLRFDFIIM